MSTSDPKPTWRQLLRDPVLLLAFGFGSGLAPRGPGTAGSLLAILCYPLLSLLPMPAYAAVLLITIVGGVWVCGRAAKTLGVHDHGGIVLDEIAGVWLAMWTFPATWPWLMAGFVVFRVFDIFKPWPINVLDRKVSGGLGIMLDDLVAGAMTWVVLFGLHKLL